MGNSDIELKKRENMPRALYGQRQIDGRPILTDSSPLPAYKTRGARVELYGSGRMSYKATLDSTSTSCT